MLVSAHGCAAGQSEGSGGLLVSNEKLRSPSSMHLLVLTDCRGHLTQTQRQRGEGDAREDAPKAAENWVHPVTLLQEHFSPF